MDVKEGDKVKQRQALGRTGQTGLAAGDHLALRRLPARRRGAARGVVRPEVDKDNIQPKLEGMSGDEIAEM